MFDVNDANTSSGQMLRMHSCRDHKCASRLGTSRQKFTHTHTHTHAQCGRLAGISHDCILPWVAIFTLWDASGGNLRATSTSCTSFTATPSRSPVWLSTAPSRLCVPLSMTRTFSTRVTTPEASNAFPDIRI